MDRKSRGFTLAELLITVAILLIIAGLIVPRLDFGFKKQKLEADASKLASNITLARQYALGQKDKHSSYGLYFYNGGYRVAPYDNVGGGWLAPAVVPSSVNPDGDIEFEEGITVSGSQDIIFDFKGALAEEVSVTVENNSATKTITASPLGRVTVD